MVSKTCRVRSADHFKGLDRRVTTIRSAQRTLHVAGPPNQLRKSRISNFLHQGTLADVNFPHHSDFSNASGRWTETISLSVGVCAGVRWQAVGCRVHESLLDRVLAG